MKKLSALLAIVLIGLSASAQSPIKRILARFDDPEEGHTVFVPKGSHSFGISGGYRNFKVGGEVDGDGYGILSMLNIGDGQLHVWKVMPKFEWFVADDFSIVARAEYSGYYVDTDVKLDFREILDSTDPALNVQVLGRHMERHGGGLSVAGRKYLSFFGSKTFGVFAEGRLFGTYGVVTSHPLREEKTADISKVNSKMRVSNALAIGLDFCVGGVVRLRDNSAFSVSIPIFGVAWNQTKQYKSWLMEEDGKTVSNKNVAKMSSFKVARSLDLISLQVGYTHYIEPKRRK